jgi:hypothetical protein
VLPAGLYDEAAAQVLVAMCYACIYWLHLHVELCLRAVGMHALWLWEGGRYVQMRSCYHSACQALIFYTLLCAAAYVL